MIDLTQRIQGFARLSDYIGDCLNQQKTGTYPDNKSNGLAIANAAGTNPWFTPEFVTEALIGIRQLLKPDRLFQWASENNLPDKPQLRKTVGLVMAGNIPAVGFHDLLCVLVSGHYALVKLSSADNYLIPALINELCRIEPGFSGMVTYTDHQLKGFDAVIATGSDNTARYFEYYFSSYPHIIRKNRNSIAIISGAETDAELISLSDDVFLYFGLGCRSVSKVFIPDSYDPRKLMAAFEKYSDVKKHSKYFNNYEYNKAIMLINREEHLDNGFLLLRPSTNLASPVSVLNYEYYQSPEGLAESLSAVSEKIQVIVSASGFVQDSVPFGRSQYPSVDDYADKVNTLEFLMSL
jgi:hypothetical protein